MENNCDDDVEDERFGINDEVKRLLVVSSRARHISVMTRALLPHVAMVQYKYDTCTLDGILGLVAQALASTKVLSIAFVFHASGDTIHICGVGEKHLSMHSLSEQRSIGEFFQTMAYNHIASDCADPRIDLIACPMADLLVGKLICQEIQKLFNNQYWNNSCIATSTRKSGEKTTIIQIGISNDLLGTGIDTTNSRKVGELYFWKKMISSTLRFRSLHHSTNQYEKIRVVGKGAFGSAVLYRRKEDDSLVVIKEINMHDLNAQERQLALNEVCLLSRLTHPNIITYYDSFEEDGVLMIEMEFADGGNLSQFLSRRERPLEEHEILIMFRQMVSAVAYLHQNGILHRDLKTANIFLKKDCTIKVGDFGISKAMSTQTQQKGAQTVLGTPYYISPEMCEGKPYGEKSDMWAIGCILYEMACLQKTFEGSNLPALVNKIMKGQYEQVRGNYSADFKALVRDLLRKAPEARPDSQELLDSRLPELLDRYDIDYYSDYHESSSEETGSRRRRTRSVLYSVNVAPFSVSPVQKLPSNIKIISVAVSATHQVIITSEKLAYAWGENSRGELGVGDTDPRQLPCLIESLTGKAVSRTAVGNGFSLFCSENGIILSCGRKERNGQEGLEEDLLRPKLIDCLLSMDVTCMSCGPEHSMVVGEGGKVLVWGSGADGRLGTSSEWDQPLPISVNIRGSTVAAVRCGHNHSVAITESGNVLVTGSNQYNKLNLAHRSGIIGRFKTSNNVSVEKVFSFTLLKNLPGRVIDVSLGLRHTLALLDTGIVLAFGCNDAGQLGRGHNDVITNPSIVRQLQDKACVMATCGNDFNLVATTDNCLYFWGRRKVRDDSSKITVSEFKVHGKPAAVIHPLRKQDPNMNEFNQSAPESIDNATTNHQISKLALDEIVSKPEQVLRLDICATTAQRQTICMSLLANYEDRCYLVVNTTVPLPHKSRRKRNDRTKGKMFTRTFTPKDDASLSSSSQSTSRTTLFGTPDNEETLVQTWIQKELQQAEVLPMQSPSHNNTKLTTNSDEETVVVQNYNESKQKRDEVERLKQAKIESEGKLFALQQDYKLQQQLKDEAYAREQDFLLEIATLKHQLDSSAATSEATAMPSVESPQQPQLSSSAIPPSEDLDTSSLKTQKQSTMCILS